MSQTSQIILQGISLRGGKSTPWHPPEINPESSPPMCSKSSREGCALGVTNHNKAFKLHLLNAQITQSIQGEHWIAVEERRKELKVTEMIQVCHDCAYQTVKIDLFFLKLGVQVGESESSQSFLE